MNENRARKRLLGPDDVREETPAAFEGRVVDPNDTLEDEVYGASLRPRTFEDYVGQESVVENLRISIDAARRRGEPLEHVLFYGPPGLGKTTLAGLIAPCGAWRSCPVSNPFWQCNCTRSKRSGRIGWRSGRRRGPLLEV